MVDLIDRQALLRDIEKYHLSDGKFQHWVEVQPFVEAEPAKRIVGKSRDGMTFWYQCDMCNEPVDAQDNFCRGCGRRLTDG